MHEKNLLRQKNGSGVLTAVHYDYTYPRPTEAVELTQTDGWHLSIEGRRNIRALARALALAGGLQVVPATHR